MPRLLYLSLMRYPTEKAHGLQIAQNCEAFAEVGFETELWVARRFNTPEMRRQRDAYAYYGVAPVYRVRRVPCVDLMPLAGSRQRAAQLAFYVQTLTYLLVMSLWVLLVRADIYYTRDEALAYVLSWLKPRRKIAYEAHLHAPTRRGAWLQGQVVRRVGPIIALTAPMREALIQRGAEPQRVMVAHDGIRRARFAALPTQDVARRRLGWPQDAYIVGFVGRLHMIGVDKGVGALVDALSDVSDAYLALVGGPDEMAAALRQQWRALGRADDAFLYAGHVPPDAVPLHLAALDVAAMPHPHTTQFAYYTSPLKLFEYMAAGRAIVASDLPAWADVVQHEDTALLVPPGDRDALVRALQRLRDDAAFRHHLGTRARQRALEHYTWGQRAARIRDHLLL